MKDIDPGLPARSGPISPAVQFPGPTGLGFRWTTQSATAALSAFVQRVARSSALERLNAQLDRAGTCWAALALLAALLAAPLLLVDIPPLLDYPNHLARAMVLASGRTDPVLSRMYAQHWDIIPNLALDLILPAMVRIMPLDVAGRVVLALALLLPVAGSIAYARVVAGRWSWWPFVSGLMAYNALFVLGFANFLIGIGCALLFAAAWLRIRDRNPVLVAAVAALGATALFFVHIFGLIYLVALVGGEEVVALYAGRHDRACLIRCLRRGLVTVPAAAVLGILYLLAPLHAASGHPFWQDFKYKYLMFFEPVLEYFSLRDLIGGPIFMLLIYLAVRKGWLRVHAAAAVTYAVLFAIYLALPFRMKSTSFIDSRVPIMLGFLLCTGLIGTAAGRRLRPVAVLALAALILVRQAGVASVWIDHRHDLAEMRRVISPVRPGSRVLVVSVQPTDNQVYWDHVPPGRIIPMFSRLDIHLAALVLIERRAFWPLMFAAPDRQPVRVLPPYAEDAVGEVPPDYTLLDPDRRTVDRDYTPNLDNWERHFDYVLLLNAGGAGNPALWLPDRLKLLAAGDVAALFEVRPPALPRD